MANHSDAPRSYRGRDARATRQRFHPTFISAHADMARREDLSKIHIRTSRRKVIMKPDLFPQAGHHGSIGFLHKQHRVRHTGVERMHRLLTGTSGM